MCNLVRTLSIYLRVKILFLILLSFPSIWPQPHCNLIIDLLILSGLVVRMVEFPLVGILSWDQIFCFMLLRIGNYSFHIFEWQSFSASKYSFGNTFYYWVLHPISVVRTLFGMFLTLYEFGFDGKMDDGLTHTHEFWDCALIDKLW